MNEWDHLSYQTGESGIVEFKIGYYTGEEVDDFGPLMVGATIYVALGADSTPPYTISEDAEMTLEGYTTTYRIDITRPTTSFKTTIPDIAGANAKVDLAVRIDNGGDFTFYQPTIGGFVFQWITGPANTGGWANIFGTWYEGVGKLDANGDLNVEINDYLSSPFTVGAKIYIAVAEKTTPSFTINEEKDVTLDGYSKTYRLDILEGIASFKTLISNVGEPNANVKLAVRIDNGGDTIFYQPTIGGYVFQWITGPANTGGWANIFGTWYEGESVLDENGALTVEINDYLGVAFQKGAKVYIAVEII